MIGTKPRKPARWKNHDRKTQMHRVKEWKKDRWVPRYLTRVLPGPYIIKADSFRWE